MTVSRRLTTRLRAGLPSFWWCFAFVVLCVTYALQRRVIPHERRPPRRLRTPLPVRHNGFAPAVTQNGESHSRHRLVRPVRKREDDHPAMPRRARYPAGGVHRFGDRVWFDAGRGSTSARSNAASDFFSRTTRCSLISTWLGTSIWVHQCLGSDRARRTLERWNCSTFAA